MLNLNLKQRLELRNSFLSKYFQSISTATHTKQSLGVVLNDYESAIVNYLNSEENKDIQTFCYYIMTLKLEDFIEHHTIKIPSDQLPHQVLYSDDKIKEGVRIINCMPITKEQYSNSEIFRILPPEMTNFKESKDE